ncbi:MAG: phenylalanine--tRNA ligase subunit beta [Clostridiales bacterium]|nr:phenylalanine--tRNA ligase subunit beta [Clostridiales bacterium]
MKAPLSWLKEYVDIDCTAEELQAKLFSCGFEVEEMVYVAKHINRIVTCKIEKIEKHPNADKLSVTQVDAGEHGKFQIITAATNIFEGAIVPVALNDSTLANGEKIYNGELRGLPSYGMFCSGEELGINDDWYEGASVNGILILDKDFPLGIEVKELLELEDVMFDINVTANRPDCQSILGLAREVAAVLGKPLKMPALTYTVDEKLSTKNTIKVTDKAFDLCPRYMAHLVKDVKIEQSPRWLKRRLASMGIRAINNIVDITNYVLLEIGQPMHAFDLSQLGGNEIIIRRAENDESIVTLDEKEFKLTSENLVICDATNPVALAGVMGGLNSEIENTTTAVVFESAKFARDNVRKTSRMLGQRTDASSRYEKGVDFYSVEIGLKRALNLICELGCGTIACDEYDLVNEEIKEKVIQTTVSKVNAVLGIDVPAATIKDILERLFFKVEICGDDLTVTVPLYREDMESYPDIAEEIIREYGYDHIEPTLLKTSAITNGGLTDAQRKNEQLKNLLVGYGFNEMINYSFVSEKEYDLFGIDKAAKEHKFIKLLNPLGEDLAVMRTSLLPSAVRAACYNINRKNYEGKLFELAKVYNPESLPLEKLPKENQILSLVTFGDNENFFTLKGVVEGILASFCAGAEVEYVPAKKTCMHPTRSADIVVNGKVVGYFGQIHPNIITELDVDKAVYGGEIYYENLVNAFNDKIVFKAISKYPMIERDLAVVLNDNVLCGDVIKVIRQAGGEYLDSVSLFDIYQGTQIGEGKKSMAFNLIFISYDRTLNVEEIDKVMKNILDALVEKLGAELR